MADGEKGHSGLSGIFNMHTLHYLMIGGMAVGAVAMTGGLAAGAVTLPDLAVATLDSGWQMLTGLEHVFSVAGDVITNTAGGDFSLNYEWGSAAHDMGGMAMSCAEHAGHAGHAAMEAASGLDVSERAADFLGG